MATPSIHKKQCSVEGCDRKHSGKGFCRMHYTRWRNNGDPLKVKRPQKSDIATCTIAGCDKPHKANGYCSSHCERARKYGDPLAGKWFKTGCEVDGCDKPHHSGGYCDKHYSNLTRRGDPEAPRLRTEKGIALPWLLDHAGHSGDDCLIWPYSRYSSGYGVVRVNGRNLTASRYMCELVNGEPPTPKHEAAHSCGNGHLGCVNPKHLRWATSLENSKDTIDHGNSLRGNRHPMAKLTKEDVIDIRSSSKTMTRKSISERFGVSQCQISDIINRKCWAWLE